MMKHIMSKITVAVVVTSALLTSGCSLFSYENKAQDETVKAELSKMGYIDPIKTADRSTTSAWKASIGTCRVTFVFTRNAKGEPLAMLGEDG